MPCNGPSNCFLVFTHYKEIFFVNFIIYHALPPFLIGRGILLVKLLTHIIIAYKAWLQGHLEEHIWLSKYIVFRWSLLLPGIVQDFLARLHLSADELLLYPHIRIIKLDLSDEEHITCGSFNSKGWLPKSVNPDIYVPSNSFYVYMYITKILLTVKYSINETNIKAYIWYIFI